MPASAWFQAQVLNTFTGSPTALSIADTYLALYLDDPTADDIGTEWTGQSRKVVTIAATPAAGPRAILEALVYPSITGVPTFTHFGLRTASSGGNLIAYNAFDSPLTPAEGETLYLPAGSLVFDVT